MPLKTFILGKRHAGRPVAAALADLLNLNRKDITLYLKNRWVRLDGKLCALPNQSVRLKQKLQVNVPREPGTRKTPQTPVKPLPALAQAIRIVYIDEHIVVVDKPPGVTTVRHADETEAFGRRGQRFLPATLVDWLPRVVPQLAKGRVRAVHRIDKETSGLVVLARTAAAESHLGKQFRAHSVERTYLALVRGAAQDQRIESRLVRDRGDGRRGSGTASDGQHAVTHVQLVEPLGEISLVECRLETGRTHQVRIHLGESGFPLCGERIYDRPLNGRPFPDPSGAARPLLHAATLAFIHPATGQRAKWDCDLPTDMWDVLQRWRDRA